VKNAGVSEVEECKVIPRCLVIIYIDDNHVNICVRIFFMRYGEL
jgi:hypothetical protein